MLSRRRTMSSLTCAATTTPPSSRNITFQIWSPSQRYPPNRPYVVSSSLWKWSVFLWLSYHSPLIATSTEIHFCHATTVLLLAVRKYAFIGPWNGPSAVGGKGRDKVIAMIHAWHYVRYYASSLVYKAPCWVHDLTSASQSLYLVIRWFLIVAFATIIKVSAVIHARKRSKELAANCTFHSPSFPINWPYVTRHSVCAVIVTMTTFYNSKERTHKLTCWFMEVRFN